MNVALQQHHQVWLGGSPQARVSAFHAALLRYGHETTTLREQCWLLVSKSAEVEAWQQDERFNGVQIITWFNWAKHWLDVAFAMAPAVMRETLNAMGLAHIELDTDAPRWHHSRERWHLLAIEEVPILLEDWLAQCGLEDSMRDEWRSLLPELASSLIDSRHIEDWHTLVAKRFPSLWHIEANRPLLMGLFRWFAQHTLGYGVIPAAWVQLASLCLVQYMKREYPERLTALFKPLALITLDKSTLLKEDAYDWVVLLASQGISIWAMGGLYTFRKRLETLPLGSITPDEREALPLMRPAFWDALTLALHPQTPTLTVVEDDVTPPRAGEVFQRTIFQRWEGSPPTQDVLNNHVAFSLVEGIMEQEHALLHQLFNWVENHASSRESSFTVLCHGVNEKRHWQQVVSRGLGFTSNDAFGLNWFQLAQQMLETGATFPWPASLNYTRFQPHELDYVRSLPEPWQLPHRAWLESPAWSEGMHTVLNACWKTLESHHPVDEATFRHWGLGMLSLLHQVSHSPQPQKALPEWLFAWQQLVMHHPMVLPTATHVLHKLGMATRGVTFTIGDTTPHIPMMAWVKWLEGLLNRLNQQAIPTLNALHSRIRVVTFEEACPFTLDAVVLPGLFHPQRQPGFGQLMGAVAEFAKTSDQERPGTYPLTFIETSLTMLQQLEELSHVVAGATTLSVVLNLEQLAEYPQEYKPILTRLLPELYQAQLAEHDVALHQNAPSVRVKETGLPAPLSLGLVQQAIALRDNDAGQYPSYGAKHQETLSPSSLEGYAKCPRQWYYSRFRFPKPSHPASARGSLVHGLLEYFHTLCNQKSLPFSRDALIELATTILDTESPQWQAPAEGSQHKWLRTFCQLPLMLRRQWRTEILESFESLEQNGFFRHTPHLVETELKLQDLDLLPLPGFKWNLTIDAVFKYPDGTIKLVDYKTYGSKLKEKPSIREEKVNRVTTPLVPRPQGEPGYPHTFTEFWFSQLPLYILAYEAVHAGEEVTDAGLQLVRSPRKVEVGSCFVPYEVVAFKSNVQEWSQALNTELIQPLFHDKTFAPNPDPIYCKNCDYTFVCDKQPQDDDTEVAC